MRLYVKHNNESQTKPGATDIIAVSGEYAVGAFEKRIQNDEEEFGRSEC